MLLYATRVCLRLHATVPLCLCPCVPTRVQVKHLLSLFTDRVLQLAAFEVICTKVSDPENLLAVEDFLQSKGQPQAAQEYVHNLLEQHCYLRRAPNMRVLTADVKLSVDMVSMQELVKTFFGGGRASAKGAKKMKSSNHITTLAVALKKPRTIWGLHQLG